MDFDVSISNLTSNGEDPVNATHQSPISPLLWMLPCEGLVAPAQHLLFNLANACFLLAYLAPSQRRGLLFMHSLLIVAFLMYSMWAWNIICSAEVFAWNFALMLLNMGQTLYIAYQMRPVRIKRELQPLFQEVFEPLQVPRTLFKKLVSPELAQIASLHSGEAYALCNLTKADRLALLIEGRVSVLSSTHYLHSISPMEFLDSPEFESCRTSIEDKFKVSVIAMTNCKYIYWPRASLEFFFVREPYIAMVMSALIARDITSKLYSMNHKIVTDKGSQLDIRLPSLTSSISSSIGDTLSNRTGKRSTTPIRKSILSLTSSLPLFENHSQLSLRASPECVRFNKPSRRKVSACSPPTRTHGFQKLNPSMSRGLIKPLGPLGLVHKNPYACNVASPFESQLELNEIDENKEPLLEMDEEYI